MRRLRVFSVGNKGVSPVIGVIITVAITVVIASVLYVWVMGFTQQTEKVVPEPLSVSPELNIERIQDELALEVTLGSRINWDNYRVLVNGTEVKTAPMTVSSAGDTVYFDYKGIDLIAQSTYTVKVLDLEANAVVYSGDVVAKAYMPEGTGIYGYITSGLTGSKMINVYVGLYRNGQFVNASGNEFSDTYSINCAEGAYELRAGYIPKIPSPEYKNYSANMTITKYRMLRHDIILQPVLAVSTALQGHVYDNLTKTPIANVEVKVTDFKTIQKAMFTDKNGYFKFSLQPLNFTITCRHPNYQFERRELSVQPNETRTSDFYLDRLPPQTARIFGYVYDNTNQKDPVPLADAEVFVKSQFLINYTVTDDSGYFQINVGAGNNTVFVNIVDYEYYEKIVTVQDKGNLMLNIYLIKETGG